MMGLPMVVCVIPQVLLLRSMRVCACVSLCVCHCVCETKPMHDKQEHVVRFVTYTHDPTSLLLNTCVTDKYELTSAGREISARDRTVA